MYGGLDVPLMEGATASLAVSGPPGRYVVCPSSEVVVASEVGTQPGLCASDSHATTPFSLMSLQEQGGTRELHLRFRCGGFPSTAVFHVLLYNDPYCASLHACWRVVVQSLLRVDINSVLGQVWRGQCVTLQVFFHVIFAAVNVVGFACSRRLTGKARCALRVASTGASFSRPCKKLQPANELPEKNRKRGRPTCF